MAPTGAEWDRPKHEAWTGRVDALEPRRVELEFCSGEMNFGIMRAVGPVQFLRRLASLRDPARAKRAVLARLPSTIHLGNRARTKCVRRRGREYVKKTFRANDEGLACFERECSAREIFHGQRWMVPIVKRGKRSIQCPRYPLESRLDRAAAGFDEEESLERAVQAGWIMFQIFLAGYAHRDFHAGNLYCADDGIVVTDFEGLAPYPENCRPAFPECYDITGHGMESPFETVNMGYAAKNHPSAMTVEEVLGVSSERLLREMVRGLKARLLEACRTFQAAGRRHVCRAHRIYSSFRLPWIEVTREEAQRHSARRFERFRITRETLGGRTILDLGSNIGGMLFEAQKFSPGRSVGVEYDASKVDIAREVAAYAGLNNVEFRRSNIDRLHVEEVGGPFDAVFCLAIEAHVRKQRRLYRLLDRITSDVLFFEGNATTDCALVERRLRENGFRHVESLGLSDDDCLPENNRRPLILARK